MKVLASLLLALFCLPGLAATPPLAPLQALAKHGARVSALVMRLDNGVTLATLNDRLPLTPASVSKLYVAAAALHQWGPGYRFTTRFLGTGPVKNGVLEGNLVFSGMGDPALTNEQLFILARRLAERGIREVKGKLVIDASYFGRVACVTDDRCTARNASRNSYDALLSSAAVNFANAEIVVMPAASAGKPASVRIAPVNIPAIRVVNEILTGPAGGSWTAGIERRTEHGRDVFIAHGSVPAGADPKRYWRALGHPDAATASLLESLLAESGIRIDDGVKIERSGAAQGRTLARIHGQPIWLQLRRMLTWSNNFMADTFTLDLLRIARAPPLKLHAGGRLLTQFGHEIESGSGLWNGKDTPTLRLESGSGLTTSSRASARDLVALLAGLVIFPIVFGYGNSQYAASHGRPVWSNGNIAAQATANSVIASANRLIEVRQSCLRSSRIAEISVPAWPMPIHQTKLMISNAQPTGWLLPQMPTPFSSSQVIETISTLNSRKGDPRSSSPRRPSTARTPRSIASGWRPRSRPSCPPRGRGSGRSRSAARSGDRSSRRGPVPTPSTWSHPPAPTSSPISAPQVGRPSPSPPAPTARRRSS